MGFSYSVSVSEIFYNEARIVGVHPVSKSEEFFWLDVTDILRIQHQVRTALVLIANHCNQCGPRLGIINVPEIQFFP